MKLLSTTFLAAGILLAACHARAGDAKDEGFGRLTVDQVDALVKSHGADVFDNNTYDEWAEGHVPGARWLDFKDVKASDLPSDHARELVFYCHNEH